MAPTSILTDRWSGWRAAIAASRTPWALAQPPEVAVEVRQFMRNTGIMIPLTGGMTAGVTRFVAMFQDCMILDGIDADGTFDYRRGPLTVDGLAGPNTLRAMRRSAAAGHRAWEFLKFNEIAVKDSLGKAPTFLNPVIHTTRDTVRLYAELRTYLAGPLPVASWYRSPRWNAIVAPATAKTSQHLLGLAIDFTPHPRLTEDVVRMLMHRVTGHNGGGVGVVEKWAGGRRVSIVGPAHADLRPNWARWAYKVKA